VEYLMMEPEAAGRPVVLGNGKVREYVFDTWLGDDVVRAYPALLVTTVVKRHLEGLANATGFILSRGRVRASPFFRRHNPAKRLPPFWVATVLGQPGRTDLGVSKDGALVVSERVLSVLLLCRVKQARFAQYVRGERACRRTRR
jgi:hypothetical protein